MAFNTKPKRLVPYSSQSSLCTTLFFIVLFTIPALFLLHISSSVLRPNHVTPWTGDLRDTQLSWNRLTFLENNKAAAAAAAAPVVLKIAVFSRKWPFGTVPGGMERHAHTLHTALARRGHKVHVFTSPVSPQPAVDAGASSFPRIHFHEGEPGKWRYNKAWENYEAENKLEPFDVVHSESVAVPHWLAKTAPNLAVSWHGIALESFQSSLYQDLIRKPTEPMSPDFNKSLYGVVPKILNEIRFFHSYAHHIAISDSCGEMLRDVYQIPNKRVHVILNGVDEKEYVNDVNLGKEFRSLLNIPNNSSALVFGIAGRLVKDKGHPLLFEAFSKLIKTRPHVYLVVAGSGPWENRYRELGDQVIVLGSMGPSELRAFYNGIDIFVNPTLRPQGLDLTLMEAMMSGKPVMASRFPSIKGSIVVEEEFGFMFTPNVESLLEAMETVVSEGRVRLAERGKACREYAGSMFSATKMALAYERLFMCIKDDRFCMYR